MDETGAYYTEQSKLERETPKQYINVYMKFRKMVMMALYARQQKRHRCKEQTFGLCRRSKGETIRDNPGLLFSHRNSKP